MPAKGAPKGNQYAKGKKTGRKPLPVEMNILEKQNEVVKYLLCSLLPGEDMEGIQVDMKKVSKKNRTLIDELVYQALNAKSSYARLQAITQVLDKALATMPRNVKTESDVKIVNFTEFMKAAKPKRR